MSSPESTTSTTQQPTVRRLLIVLVDGVRVWINSDDTLRVITPDSFEPEDETRLGAFLSAWLFASEDPNVDAPMYVDYRRPGSPTVPLSSEDLQNMATYAPCWVDLSGGEFADDDILTL